MRTQTKFHWLMLALVALASLLSPAAWADWADATSYLTTSATPRAFDRATGQIFSYVTITNTAPGTVTGPLRLVIPTSNFSVTGAAGTTTDSKPYLNIPAPMTQGQKVTLRVSFTQQRGVLAFTTRPERYNPPTVATSLPSAVTEGQAVTGIAQVSGAQGPLTFLWEQTSGPAVTLTGASTGTLNFTAPATTGSPVPIGFKLTVTDGTGKVTTANSIISVQPDNIYVTAGADRTVFSGQTVSLFGVGGGSGPSSIFAWTQVLPTGTPVTLTNAGTSNPNFVAPTVTTTKTVVFQVSFTDGLKTATDQIAIEVQPVPAQASANAPLILVGTTQQIPLLVVAQPAAEVPGGTVQNLAATGSGGDSHYTWLWKVKGAPVGPGGPATIGATNGPTLQVTLPTVSGATTYAFEVELTDGSGNIANDSTTLFAYPSPSASPLRVEVPSVAVSEGPPAVALSAIAVGGTGPYTYAWTQTGGPTATLTGAATASPSIQPPAVNADTTLTFHVVVTDSTSTSVARDMNVLVRNSFAITPPQPLSLQVPPTLTAVVGTPVSLGAVASGGTPAYTWAWAQTGGTATATLSGTTTNTLGLTPTSAGTLILQATVTDSAGTPVTKQGNVLVNVLAAPAVLPLAVPEIPKLYVDEGTAGVAVTALATGGTGSYSYSWQFIPSGGLTSLTLANTTTNTVHFDAPQVSAQSTLQLRVTVTDGSTSVTRDAWVVINDITPPLDLISTGQPLTVTSGQTVNLGNGIAPRGGTGPYTYAWTQTAGPSAGTITGAGTANPSFTAPTVTQSTPLTFTLTVTDAAGHQQTATQTVTVNPAAGPSMGFQVSISPGNGNTMNRLKGGQAAQAEVRFGTSGIGPYTYHWVQTQGPSIGDLSTFNGQLYHFTTPQVSGEVTIGLSVTVTDSSAPPQVVTNSGTATITSGQFTVDGIMCLVCGDKDNDQPCSDMDLVLAQTTACPSTQPYCMNDVIQNGEDVQQFKRCVDDDTCHSQWYQATSDNQLCLHFDPSSPADNLVCHLCCFNGWSDFERSHACNIETNPPDNLLYRP